MISDSTNTTKTTYENNTSLLDSFIATGKDILQKSHTAQNILSFENDLTSYLSTVNDEFFEFYNAINNAREFKVASSDKLGALIEIIQKLLPYTPPEQKVVNIQDTIQKIEDLQLELKLWSFDFSEAAKAYLTQGNTFFGLQQYERAILYYTKSIEYNNRNGHAFLNCGKTYFQLKQYYISINFFTQAIDKGLNHADVFRYRAEAYQNNSEFQNAVDDYTTILIKTEFTDKFSYCKRGECYFFLEQYEKAIPDFIKGIELDKNNIKDIDYYRDLFVLCYKKLQRWDKAIITVTEFIVICPNNDERRRKLLEQRGECYLQQKEFYNAIKDFNQSIDPKNNDKQSGYFQHSSCFKLLSSTDRTQFLIDVATTTRNFKGLLLTDSDFDVILNKTIFFEYDHGLLSHEKEQKLLEQQLIETLLEEEMEKLDDEDKLDEENFIKNKIADLAKNVSPSTYNKVEKLEFYPDLSSPEKPNVEIKNVQQICKTFPAVNSLVFDINLMGINSIVDEGLKFFAKHYGNQLISLSIISHYITDDGIIVVSENCPNLILVSLMCKITDVGVEHLTKNCQKLESLQLNSVVNGEITDATPTAIKQNCTHLQHLKLFNKHITEEGFKILSEAPIPLKSIDLRGQFTNKSIQNLSKSFRLTHCSIQDNLSYDCTFTDEILKCFN